MTERSSAATSALPELTLTRVFDAPRRLVFKAWTDESQVAKWWGPKGFTTPLCKLDAHPGGAIRIDMRAPNGVVYPMGGRFIEIVEPEKLVFTTTAIEDKDGRPLLETIVTVTFAEEEGKTKLTVHVRVTKAGPEASSALAGMEQGWTETVSRLESFVITLR